MQKHSLTEQQLETFLLEGRGISDRGVASTNGSFSRLPTEGIDSPSRSSMRNGTELNETIHTARDLIKQLSAVDDADAARAVQAS